LGRYSQFDQTFGYYADGVSPETAALPQGWEARLIRVSNENTAGAVGWCLEPHDLAFSKLAARREKDLTFVTNLLRLNLIRPMQLERSIRGVEDAALRDRLLEAFEICRTRQGNTN
jgi:Nucleotidyltransferase of unknown function (DUF6036)